MARVMVCARIDPEDYEILKRIKEEYGIDASKVLRLAASWFIKRFYFALKRVELELQLSLDQVEEALREGLAAGLEKEGGGARR